MLAPQAVVASLIAPCSPGQLGAALPTADGAGGRGELAERRPL